MAEYRIDSLNYDLDLAALSRSLDNYTASYKFYWIEAIILLVNRCEGKCEFTMSEIFDEMIVNAWHSRAYYHLHLSFNPGGKENGDQLEQAIDYLLKYSSLKEDSSLDEIRAELKKHAGEIMTFKNNLQKYVPKRYLVPFLRYSYESYSQIIEAINETNKKGIAVPYTFGSGKMINRKVIIDDHWAELFKKEQNILLGWVNYNKAIYLQSKNTEVPGVINKLSLINQDRSLTAVHQLWYLLLSKGTQLKDIYSNVDIAINDYHVDHFIPWSYIASNEIWNLLPIQSAVNINKSNSLPDWDRYLPGFLNGQFILYSSIHEKEKSDIKNAFSKCIDKYLTAPWAADLYLTPSIEHEAFSNEISKHLKPLYLSAENLGYRVRYYQEHLSKWIDL